MKHVRMMLVIAMAICSTTIVNAQVKKSPTVKAEQKMVYSCPMKCEGSKTYDKPGKCPKCNMKLKAKKVNATAVNYQCPMKCEGEKMYTAAGKCPTCNMNLKEVTAKNTEDHKGHNHN